MCGVDLPDPPETPFGPAVEFIQSQAGRFPGEVTICTIGPMTTLAIALRLDPALAANLKAIAFMGGAAFCPGNMNDFAEFNIFLDPHAAEIVMQSGVPLVMFGLDVTMKATILPEYLAALRQNVNACSVASAQMLEAYGGGDLFLHDPCVIAWLIDPTLFSGVQARIHVATDSGVEFGRTLASPDPAGNCLVMTDLDHAGLFSLLTGRLTLLP